MRLSLDGLNADTDILLPSLLDQKYDKDQIKGNKGVIWAWVG